MTNKTSANEVVTIRFSGDSGDGMQLTGNQFSDNTAIFGNDLNTLPDFPAEIRAPAGSLFGVSSFQLQFGSREIFTAGDDLDVLVSMNPAALKVHLKDLKENGLLVINTDNFTPKNLRLAKYEDNPLENNDLEKKYRVIKVGMTKLVNTALDELELTSKEKARSTNMFALGLLYWLYERNMQTTIDFLINILPYTSKSFQKRITPYVSVNYAQALPGTPLFEYAREKGFIEKPKVSLFIHGISCVILRFFMNSLKKN